jgi:hypothetical protein
VLGASSAAAQGRSPGFDRLEADVTALEVELCAIDPQACAAFDLPPFPPPGLPGEVDNRLNRVNLRFNAALFGWCDLLEARGVAAFYCDAVRSACPVPPAPPPDPQVDCFCWNSLEVGAFVIAPFVEPDPDRGCTTRVTAEGLLVSSNDERFQLETNFATGVRTCTGPSVSRCDGFDPGQLFCGGLSGVLGNGGGTREITPEEADACLEILEWGFGLCDGTTDPPGGTDPPG